MTLPAPKKHDPYAGQKMIDEDRLQDAHRERMEAMFAYRENFTLPAAAEATEALLAGEPDYQPLSQAMQDHIYSRHENSSTEEIAKLPLPSEQWLAQTGGEGGFDSRLYNPFNGYEIQTHERMAPDAQPWLCIEIKRNISKAELRSQLNRARVSRGHPTVYADPETEELQAPEREPHIIARAITTISRW